jgi:hypothetical protein
MADDKSNAGGQDQTRVALTEDYEVQDWARCAPPRGPPSGVALWYDRRLLGDEFEGSDVGR